MSLLLLDGGALHPRQIPKNGSTAARVLNGAIQLNPRLPNPPGNQEIYVVARANAAAALFSAR